jgi:toxin ParE1/3/4
MSLPLVFRQIAQLELDESVSWYESRRSGLGLEFMTEIQRNLDRIGNEPKQFKRVRGEIRRSVLRRFPYSIYFLREVKRIVILAVFHARRDPQSVGRRFRTEGLN